MWRNAVSQQLFCGKVVGSSPTMRRLGIPYGVPVFFKGTQKIKNIKYQMNDRLVPLYRCGETLCATHTFIMSLRPPSRSLLHSGLGAYGMQGVSLYIDICYNGHSAFGACIVFYILSQRRRSSLRSDNRKDRATQNLSASPGSEPESHRRNGRTALNETSCRRRAGGDVLSLSKRGRFSACLRQGLSRP